MQIHWNRLISRVRSQARQRSRARRRADSASRAQIQCLDSRVLLSAVTGGTGVFVDSEQDLGQYNQLALGDLDGDGDIDAFVAQFHAAILLNNGSGSFAPGGQTLSNPSAISDIELGDLDGDGDLDAVLTIAVAAERRGQILFNDGSGSFIDSGQSLGTDTQLAATLGDLDGDGDLDIILTTSTLGAPTRLMVNDGTGKFASAGQVFAANSSDVALADFDGDEDLDAVVGTDSGPSQVWINDGNANFAAAGIAGTRSHQTAATGDLDGDGDIDLLLTSRSGSPSPAEIWLNDGNANFQDSEQRLGNAATTNRHTQALGDLDGDGDLDVVIADRNGPDKVWLNDGSGTSFTDSGQEIGGPATERVSLADTDGDGDLDIFVTDRTDVTDGVGPSSLWLNQDQPVEDQINLPVSGGTYEVLINGGDLVVRELGGNELFRGSQNDVPRLQIHGSDADDTLIVDFSGGNPIPGSRLEFFAGNQTGEDALVLGSGTVTSVSHSFTSDNSGSVIVDGAMLLYSGVEPITDSMTSDRRYFTYADTSDDVTLEDNGTGSDGISRIANVTTGRTLDFINPSSRLVVNSGTGNDTVTLNSPDALFSAAIAVNGQDDSDLLRSGTLTGSVRLTGGTGDDMLVGGMQDDTLDGGAGDDVLNGRGGNDTLLGGHGDDSLLGGAGADLLDGVSGFDRLFGQGGSGDTLTGVSGFGDDTLNGGAGRDWLVGNVYYSTAMITDSQLVRGDSISVDELDSIELLQLNARGNSGHRIDASGFSGPVMLRGNTGDDTLIGSSQDDLLDGGGGDDSLIGGDGHDSLDAGDGNDVLLGGDGNDSLDAGDGDDTLIGGSGDDSLHGGWGNDAIAGQAGNDWLNGRRDDDTILGGDGNDVLLGGGQNDILLGEDGDDLVRGHSGEDTLTGAGMGTTASPDDTVLGGTIDDAFTVDISWLTV